MQKIMFNCRGAMLIYDTALEKYEIRREGSAKKEFSNPLIAWRSYWETVDGIMMRRIGDTLEKQRKNRFTGEPETTLFEEN